MAGLRGPLRDPDAVSLRGGEHRDRRVELRADEDRLTELRDLAEQWTKIAKTATNGIRREGSTYKTTTGFRRPTVHVANLKEATNQLRQLALAIARLEAALPRPDAHPLLNHADCPPAWTPELLTGTNDA